MKKQFILLFVAIMFIVTKGTVGQTTITFKPDPSISQDAMIMKLDGDCLFSGQTTPHSNTNFGSYPSLFAVTWTWGKQGCSGGVKRSLLKFTQLNSIPSSAIILSADLKLYGVEPPVWANSHYPGSPYPNTNPSWIEQITSPWNANTVTWNTQPTTTSVNRIAIPPSNTQFNWDFSDNSANLVAMIQDMISNPTNNHGFMLQLQTEEKYRSMCFASSDYYNHKLWPELTVTYTLCNPNFTYQADTEDPYKYTFTAKNQTGYFTWMINNQYVPLPYSASSFDHVFTPGSYRICLTYSHDTIPNKCERCINICVDKDDDKLIVFMPKEENLDINKGKEVPLKSVFSEEFSINQTSHILVYPNPTENNWKLEIYSEEIGEVEIYVRNVMGKMISIEKQDVVAGMNTFSIKGENLSKGVYLMEVKGKNINATQKIIKE